MAGPEQDLVIELRDIVVDGSLPKGPLAADKVGGLANSLTAGGSANWPPLGWAVRYRKGDPAAQAQWQAFFPASRKTFMGIEEFSTIYGTMHLLSVAAVHDQAKKNGDPLEKDALEWLQYWFGIAELERAKDDGTILMVGMRSGGHPPDGGVVWNGWLRALARGEDPGPWEARAKQLKLGMKLNWAYPTAKALQATLAEAVAGDPPLPDYGLLSPLHILETDEGIAVWCEKNVNGNTTPLMGAVAIFGKSLDYLPPDGGDRIRQKFEHVTCARDGDNLVYDSDLQGRHELPLPGGTVVRDVVLGVLPDEPAPEQPQEPAPQEPAPQP